MAINLPLPTTIVMKHDEQCEAAGQWSICRCASRAYELDPWEDRQEAPEKDRPGWALLAAALGWS